MSSPWFVAYKAAAALSLAGDTLILTTSGHIRRHTSVHTTPCTVWLLTWLALSDVVARVPDLFNGPRAWELGTAAPCVMLGIVHWFGKWASWAWVAAYAWVIQHNSLAMMRNLDRGLTDARAVLSHRAWRILHALCWGVPLLLLGAVYADGSYFAGKTGPSDSRSSREKMCGLTIPNSKLPYAEVFTALLWPIILYNVFAFVRVHCALRQRVRSATALLDPELQTQRSVTTLWPYFLLYVLTFVVSQAPAVCLEILNDYMAVSAPLQAAMLLQSLHGFLNGLTYGITNRAFLSVWRNRFASVRASTSRFAPARASLPRSPSWLLKWGGGSHAEPPSPLLRDARPEASGGDAAAACDARSGGGVLVGFQQQQQSGASGADPCSGASSSADNSRDGSSRSSERDHSAWKSIAI